MVELTITSQIQSTSTRFKTDANVCIVPQDNLGVDVSDESFQLALVTDPKFKNHRIIASICCDSRRIELFNCGEPIHCGEHLIERFQSKSFDANFEFKVGGTKFEFQLDAKNSDSNSDSHSTEINLLKQVFSDALAKQLLTKPELLIGTEREISVLFCDMRRFSRIADEFESTIVCDLLSDVMERLTDEIMNFEGVVIDYYGDGIAAMWNAPFDQADHPQLACQAALQIQRAMLDLNVAWEPILNSKLKVGIGIHTGLAKVGNAGSTRRIKYGPRGKTVNIASRIESATKQLGVPILISAQTQKRLADSAITRKICVAQVDGSTDPIELYEIYTAGSMEIPTRSLQQIKDYQIAIESFENGDLELAQKQFQNLLMNSADDPAATPYMKFVVDSYLDTTKQNRKSDTKISDFTPTIQIRK